MPPINPELPGLPSKCETFNTRDVADFLGLAVEARPDEFENFSAVARNTILSVSERAEILEHEWLIGVNSALRKIDKQERHNRSKKLMGIAVEVMTKVGLALGPSMGYYHFYRPRNEQD